MNPCFETATRLARAIRNGRLSSVEATRAHLDRIARVNGPLKALVLDGVPASYRDMARYTLANVWLTWPLQMPLSWLMPDGDSAITAIPQLAGLPVLLYQSLDDEVVPLSNGVRLYQAAPPPRVLQLTRGGHVQTFAEPLWRQVMLRFVDDPTGMTSLPRLAEIADKRQPIPVTPQPESP